MSATPLSPGGLLISARWRRSSRSTGMNNCVEAAVLDGGLLAVRDSKRTDGPAVLFTGSAWTGFLASVRADVHA
ncbi:DUF397 domain-containing protein [Streptomyces virginiae]|uniref:DUF397 domain-containing protein n=1 Tax=Streptomyces virginiae TaxID=1961 RepID=A0ABZ1TM27_STRVG|nr:DUF397 domain-containing protein [Streptomyces virginiae]MYV76541.1 DUF397 domain-containing protein [Streptomyces sp. SID1046]MCX4720984.1 DUF397 domain-containing protein [Streptomyces virginiae]MCX5275496.1 DUF397 domain-containing protein [Streptomyces virginiae]WSC76396.1 DUF397 domain-containing protein [Streptomyces virginiae]WTB25957.1 DUF397 domain-containing protein [Streptomyces virginiae]